MLIPKCIFPVVKFSAKEKTRYALNSVLLDRKGNDGGPRAIATDGRRLIIVEWNEPEPDKYPTLEGLPHEKPDKPNVEGTMVPVSAWEKACKAIPKMKFRPVLEHAIFDETDSETVRMGATDLETVEKFESRKLEGHYPEFDTIVPTDLTDYVTLGVSPALLCETVKVVETIVGKGVPVRLHVPSDGNAAIVVEAKNDDGIKAKAILMPVELGN